jgi:multidrug resistance efflux pump
LYAQPGQEVVAGQVLAEVQGPELEKLGLELANAETELRLAEANLQSAEAARGRGALSTQSLLEEQVKRQERLNALEIARRKIESLGLKTDTSPGEHSRSAVLPVRSPVAGVVIHADVRIGQVIEPRHHLFEVVDLSTVRVQAALLERDLSRVRAGQTLRLHLAA